ncbi:hypothetical protein FACS1894152_1340 [Bacilli bacterium]|nr:hypothetical protein FACS1894152_1340 [Bacilli bacterium]
MVIKTTPIEIIKRKQAKVNIDFTRDNYLPGLNREDLEKLGKKSKPVLLKKSIIDKNKHNHPEVDEMDYDFILCKSLYEHEEILTHLTQKLRNRREHKML